jgi:hypothetical protein
MLSSKFDDMPAAAADLEGGVGEHLEHLQIARRSLPKESP